MKKNPKARKAMTGNIHPVAREKERVMRVKVEIPTRDGAVQWCIPNVSVVREGFYPLYYQGKGGGYLYTPLHAGETILVKPCQYGGYEIRAARNGQLVGKYSPLVNFLRVA